MLKFVTNLKNAFKLSPSSYFVRHSTCIALKYSKNGEPMDVVYEEVGTVPDTLPSDHVVVQYLAAPVNPADINTIQGTYPIKPHLPAVAGNEGVGKVVARGAKVEELSVGDLVIPAKPCSGTWTTHMCTKSSCFMKLPVPVSPSVGAVLSTNPSTALRMLSDYATMQPGDVIVQNGSTSAVGIYVIQMARLFGYRTINFFRPRDNEEATEETRQLLMDFGADVAITEAELKSDHTLLKSIGPVKLALTCSGGKSVVPLLRCLNFGGKLVTYGAMARQPMSVPVGPLIFNGISLHGFWLSNWIRSQMDDCKRNLMLKQLACWFNTGTLKVTPHVEIPFSEWREALKLSSFGSDVPTGVTKKVIMTMN